MPSFAQWSETWRQLGIANADDGLFRELIARYSEPHRKYHTLQHLGECLENFQQLRSISDFPPEIELGLWFHDAVYDVTKNDNEAKSADWARTSILAKNNSIGNGAGTLNAAADRVHALIMATRHKAAPAGLDAGILVDVDLWILGAPADRFDEYEQQIREEYRHVPDFLFVPRRRALLTELLNRPRLFATELFHERLELRAHANIARSLQRLNARRGGAVR